ncbi:Heat shock factor (HSF)-type DNA-binding [Arabidopsis suecica]|uniref:Heat shock factor (HSF)-type DNA-binding n=2 Tax=Arabidopsis suecica TaxID=45249 RepID=A0A8T1Z925_ARASU|nr:Heat shock factor (HSF)-type DNA-binding [Arabidopsis suecica]
MFIDRTNITRVFYLGILLDLKRVGLMVRDNNPGGSSRPYRSFPTRLYEMVNDPLTDSVISWSESGKSFIVWNQSELCSEVLPKFSLGKVFSNFTFKLDTFGFRKVESDQWEYANDDFERGKPELTEEIQKRFLASLSPEAFVFKRSAEDARVIERTRALQMAMKERALAKNLSNLTL